MQQRKKGCWTWSNTDHTISRNTYNFKHIHTMTHNLLPWQHLPLTHTHTHLKCICFFFYFSASHSGDHVSVTQQRCQTCSCVNCQWAAYTHTHTRARTECIAMYHCIGMQWEVRCRAPRVSYYWYQNNVFAWTVEWHTEQTPMQKQCDRDSCRPCDLLKSLPSVLTVASFES